MCVYRGQFQISQGSPGAGIIYDCDVYDICDGKQTQALWKAACALNYWGISPTSKLFFVIKLCKISTTTITQTALQKV